MRWLLIQNDNNTEYVKDTDEVAVYVANLKRGVHRLNSEVTLIMLL
jgi:hypothetical protein